MTWLLFDDIEVVPVIVLVDDVIPVCAELLEHAIQHLGHLFLRLNGTATFFLRQQSGQLDFRFGNADSESIY